MIKFETGQVFPLSQYLNGGEVTVSHITNGLFDLVCVLSDLSSEEIAAFKKGKLSIYLYERENVPFIVYDFGSFTVDVTIEISKIKNDEDVDAWLNADSNIMNLFLVEATTGILKANRFISVPLNFTEKIKDICEKTPEDITHIINSVRTTTSTDQMIKHASMGFDIRK